MALDWVGGLGLILLGLIGLVVPVLPGVVFIVAGVAVLSSHSRHARALQSKARALFRRALRRDGARGDETP
jgi:uncharacterized protein YqgC (DUF456 family)